MDVKRDELVRLVMALSSACQQDKNVLKDGELVDALETHGRQIAHLRKQQETDQTIEDVKKQLVATDGVLKRRKLSLQTDPASSSDPMEAFDGSYEDAPTRLRRFPSTTASESMDEWTSPLQSRNKTVSTMDSVDAEAQDWFKTPSTGAVTGGVRDEAVMVNPVKMCQHHHVRRDVSPQMKLSPAVGPASSLKREFYRPASPDAVDLTASTTSTMASYYDDMYSDYAVGSEAMQRHTRSVCDRTSSFETMDWRPSCDDRNGMGSSFRSIADDAVQQSPVSRSVYHQRLNHAEDAQLNVFDLHSGSSANVCYSANEGQPAGDVSPRTNVLKRKNKLRVALSTTEVVMEVLYGIMEHNEKFKWLIDPVNQARVALLVEYHLKEWRNGDTSVYEDEQLVCELRAQVDELIYKNLKIQTENVQLTKKVSQSRAIDINIEELRRRLALSEEAVSMHEGYRRESEAAFQSELQSKSELVARFQQDVAKKDSQIALLLQKDAQPSAYSATNCDEVSRLQEEVLEKDREICRLNLQLSTKRELVAEIAKKVAQHLETTLNVSSKETTAALVQGLRLDMDMLLFQSVAEKQKVIDELKASLLSVQREVSGLEAQLAEKEHNTLQLKTKFKSMSSRLTGANVNMSRIQSENDRLVAALKEKQRKMHALLEFLEGKEKQVMYLEQQEHLRQTGLEHVVTEHEQLQC
uniref:Uncharacterized protein n=1 Tax=Peronospora matthiolae TaxID=2874970 RepID=A0AAV1UXE7_9STRA